MNEYVDYYKEHCLKILKDKAKNSKGEIVEIQGEIILNDIDSVDYKKAVDYVNTIVIEDSKKIKQLLSEEYFVNNKNLHRYLGKLDSRKLWKLSVLLYTLIAQSPVAEISLTVADEYIKLFNSIHKGLEVTNITFSGKLNKKSKHITINSEELLAKILWSYLEYHDEIMKEKHYKHYTIKKITTINELVNKRTLDYYFAKELEQFITSYQNGKFTTNERMLILQILYLFGRSKNNIPINTDNYRTLMNDSNQLKINTPLQVLEGKLLPFTIISNPEIIKLRQEYLEVMAKL